MQKQGAKTSYLLSLGKNARFPSWVVLCRMVTPGLLGPGVTVVMRMVSCMPCIANERMLKSAVAISIL